MRPRPQADDVNPDACRSLWAAVANVIIQDSMKTVTTSDTWHARMRIDRGDFVEVCDAAGMNGIACRERMLDQLRAIGHAAQPMKSPAAARPGKTPPVHPEKGTHPTVVTDGTHHPPPDSRARAEGGVRLGVLVEEARGRRGHGTGHYVRTEEHRRKLREVALERHRRGDFGARGRRVAQRTGAEEGSLALGVAGSSARRPARSSGGVDAAASDGGEVSLPSLTPVGILEVSSSPKGGGSPSAASAPAKPKGPRPVGAEVRQPEKLDAAPRLARSLYDFGIPVERVNRGEALAILDGLVDARGAPNARAVVAAVAMIEAADEYLTRAQMQAVLDEVYAPLERDLATRRRP